MRGGEDQQPVSMPSAACAGSRSVGRLGPREPPYDVPRVVDPSCVRQRMQGEEKGEGEIVVAWTVAGAFRWPSLS